MTGASVDRPVEDHRCRDPSRAAASNVIVLQLPLRGARRSSRIAIHTIQKPMARDIETKPRGNTVAQPGEQSGVPL
jgi:hypothetical protein